MYGIIRLTAWTARNANLSTLLCITAFEQRNWRKDNDLTCTALPYWNNVLFVGVLDFTFWHLINAMVVRMWIVCSRIGTTDYMAPELLLPILGSVKSFDPVYDGRAVDSWAMGVILYVMVAGSYPFQVHMAPHPNNSIYTAIHYPYLTLFIAVLLTSAPSQTYFLMKACDF